MTEHVWMEHEVTKHRAQLPDLPYWRAHGWSPCDGPPPEPDLLHDPVPAPAQPEAADQPAVKPAKSEKVTRG